MKRVAIIILIGLIFAVTFARQRSITRKTILNRVAANRTSTELAAEGFRLRRLIESKGIANSAELEAAFEQMRRQSRLRIEWIHLRETSGDLEAQPGGAPVMKIKRYGSGSIVVAEFAVRRPATMNGRPWKLIINRESV